MTGDEKRRYPARRGARDSRSAADARNSAGRPTRGSAARGLLDDLPEAGRGAGAPAAGTAATAPRRNPFHTPAKPAAAPRTPASEPAPRPEADRAGGAAGSAAPAPPAEAVPSPVPAADPDTGDAAPPYRPPARRDKTQQHTGQEQETESPLEPNVIPLRGGGPDRAPATTVDPPGGDTDDRAQHAEPAPVHEPPFAPRYEPAESAPSEPPPAVPAPPDLHTYAEQDRDAIYRAMRERRDVRMGFRADPVPDEVLTRVLGAAHMAPSVGFSQPWDFLIVEDEAVRASVQDLAQSQREEYARALPAARARAFSGLKVEAILDTPLNIVVTVDATRGGRHTLGRHAQPQTAAYSTALAVQNLWLAARAEGLGVGWVSFFDERDLAAVLDLPPHLQVVAYLCVGYVEDFPTEPELALGGWAQRRPLSWAVHRDHYGRRGLPGEEPTSLLEETIAAIGPLDPRAVAEAEDRHSRMTMPPGALGDLQEVAVRLAGLSGECPPPIPEPAAVAIFAGDHGVHAQGVTSWPQEVTAQMVQNFLSGGAVANAFAAQVGAEVTVVDVGVVGDLPAVPGLLPRKIARGTADISRAPAMTRTQAEYAIEAGIEVARDLASAGNRCLITGDMGIANTTPSAALIAAFTGADPAEVTGRGTGVDDAVHEHKVEVVRRALAVNAVDPEDPVGVLAAVGGLEHAALAGFILGAAALRVPVLLDGVIAGAASLAAAAIAPEATNACFAGHRSAEPGHTVALDHLGLRPLVDLEMRLGEGSGALLALPLLQAAARALRDVATFDSAGVSERG
ncbi:nicotinate-nucleotide--dimethylbenzimidazole phosphoribosyltransferase [Nocardiopsis mwathae]|uniref:Nicotinate-nucleotide--dimethylbenzimidazole phosphoribosyltransferase n=1 Tax=Nocardiopsis mwathae TaxID=1472723 RepID=A0A7X0D562_9ACTN|nr:nicotinate-nucleotide--dimethylbenzimidazole phosphoribosyltransferase [Nocardiopsis mwathae]MBB6170809.1 nicotinate-nucleotide--dimethylbenzimidazole phosphoribosyltransferase [Nocardiopsis mwathae]